VDELVLCLAVEAVPVYISLFFGKRKITLSSINTILKVVI
jgi:hypothetical protein